MMQQLDDRIRPYEHLQVIYSVSVQEEMAQYLGEQLAGFENGETD